MWDEARLEAERMGAILGVARGADRPPRLVILRYRNGGGGPTLGLVGKGVTFDSGGLSLKTTEQHGGHEVRHGRGGGRARRRPGGRRAGAPVNVLGVLPLVENMPGGRAMKLGDVLTARNGKTIEVLNTDAEGRLILADALAYAAEQKPDHIVDLATLTGACMVALGTEIGRADDQRRRLGRPGAGGGAAGRRAGLAAADGPGLTTEMIKSKVADMKNVPAVAVRRGHRRRQVPGAVRRPAYPWVHLDIAGPAWADHEGPSRDAGGTGAFVRTLIELAATYGG